MPPFRKRQAERGLRNNSVGRCWQRSDGEEGTLDPSHGQARTAGGIAIRDSKVMFHRLSEFRERNHPSRSAAHKSRF